MRTPPCVQQACQPRASSRDLAFPLEAAQRALHFEHAPRTGCCDRNRRAPPRPRVGHARRAGDRRRGAAVDRGAHLHIQGAWHGRCIEPGLDPLSLFRSNDIEEPQ